jgi:hypothetical protein
MAPKIKVVRPCRNCGNQIPPGVIVDGRRRDLSIRRYCLDCSPFGGRNSIKLEEQRADGLKTCATCKADFSAVDGFPRKSGHCWDCHNAKIRIKRAAFKARCVVYLGGKCFKCGYSECLAALDFHHRGAKDFDISRFRSRSFDQIKPELDKCVVACANCHAKVHASKEQFEWMKHLDLLPEEGKVA